MRMRLSLLVVSALWMLTTPLGAAGTITQTHYTIGNIRKVVFTCTADAANGSYPATAISAPIEGRLIQLITDPGSTAPTDNYDITLVDANGLDVLQGVGANRDTANTEAAAVVFTSTSVNPVVDESDTLTLTIANNSVNSATITITLVYALGG
jgi:hypothetical protein